MFNQPSSSLEIYCDAPAYAIVQAARMIGMRTPEDIRWYRLSNFIKDCKNRLELFDFRTWKNLLGRNEAQITTCSCGHHLPRLEKYTFTYSTGREVEHVMGQCPRCWTIYWE
jgi:hypothetical protein